MSAAIMVRLCCVVPAILLAAACGAEDTPHDAGTTTASSEASTGPTTSNPATTGDTATATGTTSSSTSTGGDPTGEGGTTSSADATTDAQSTGNGDAACFPEGGIYGSCASNPGCQCLQGAAVYQACTISCDVDAECGVARDFPGAIPGCFPLNPGAADKICALVCTDPGDCPCGLTCTASGVPNVSICAELQ